MARPNGTEELYSIRLGIEAREAPVAALYSDLRLNPEQVPHGWHRYSIRETDGGSGEPATIERHVLVNHLMDILTTENLDSLIEKKRRLSEHQRLRLRRFTLRIIPQIDSFATILPRLSVTPAAQQRRAHPTVAIARCRGNGAAHGCTDHRKEHPPNADADT